MKKHYALYRDGLLLIRTKTFIFARKIQEKYEDGGSMAKFEIIKEEHMPEVSNETH